MADPQKKAKSTDVLNWDDEAPAAPAASTSAPTGRPTDVLDYGDTTKAAPAAPPEPKKEGLGGALLGDLGAMAKRMFLPPTSWAEAGQRLKGVAEMVNGKPLNEAYADYAERRDKGYGPVYSSLSAPMAEGVGVNVKGMENAASAGDTGGVWGHALAVPVAMAAAKPLGNLAGNTGRAFMEGYRGPAPVVPPVDTSIGPPDVYRAGYSQPRAYPAQTAAPIPPRSGLMLPGEVQPVTAYDNVAGLRSKLTTPDAEAARYGSAEAYENVDPLRQKLTSPEAEHPAMALYGGESLRGVPGSNPLKNFMTENPSALGRIPQPGPATRPVETPDIVDETRQAIREGRASKIPTRIKTKPEAPAQPPETPQKPVEPPKKTPPQRQTDYMFGEHGQGADIGSENYRRVRAQTMDELAAYANKKGLKGRTNWTADELRGKQADGKSSKPNAQYIRGQMLKDAGSKPDALGAVGKPEEKPFDPFDEMAAYQPGRSVHDVLGLRGGVPKPKK